MRKITWDDIEEGTIFTYGRKKELAGSFAGIKCYVYRIVGDDKEYCIVKTMEPAGDRKAGYKFEDRIDDIIDAGSTIVSEERKAYHPEWW